MASYDDVPEAFPVEEFGNWNTPTGVPTDPNGRILIPELTDRQPTHNEAFLLSGQPVSMASTNVQEFWWKWGEYGNYSPKLFVRFLDGALYVYEGQEASLTLASQFIETMSPGRFVWNVLRQIWPVPDSKGTGPGTYHCVSQGSSGGSSRRKRKPQVVRLVK